MAGNDQVVEIEVNVLVGHGSFAAVIDVDPHLLDLERVHVAEANVGLLKSDLPVDPAAEDAVALATAASFARRVELAVLLDAVLPSVL